MSFRGRSSPLATPPTRPRSPGQDPSLLEQLRQQGTQVMLVALVAGGLLIFGIALLVFAGGDEQAAGPDNLIDDGSAGGDPLLRLPLDLQAVGFDDGSIATTTEEEGPGAVTYCDNRAATTGLIDWTGNRLTEAGDRQRIAQMLIRFRNSLDAANFARSNSDIITCEQWSTGSSEGKRVFSIEERVPANVYGDETRLYRLQTNDDDGPVLFLETILVRSGRDVAQFTVVSANRQDLDRLDRLTADAVETLGF